MNIFTKLYNKMLSWAQHNHAPYYLAGVSFAESSFFPIPPDVMLAPMVLAKPIGAWRLALLTTFFSVLGGMLGYMIGFFAFDTIGVHLVNSLNLQMQYQTVVEWFNSWGWWIILLAGITPIPYKIFTIAAGVSHMALGPFVLASLVGRSFRFFLVAGLVKILGPRVEKHLLKHLDTIGWALVAIVAIVIILLKMF